MILADTSVWIDFLRKTPTWQRDRLREALRAQEVLLGDLVLAEILQGYGHEEEARRVESQLQRLEIVEIGGRNLVQKAAKNYRLLRRNGVTVRSTIDTLIATRCILDGLVLLHRDRDFEPFVEHFGLKVIERQTN